MTTVTQKDIAQILNISRETVTKALQDHPKVAKKTRELVKAKAKELGYNPNFIARNLVSGRSYTIGVVLPKVAQSYFSQSFEYIFYYCRKNGYQVLPMVSFEQHEIEVQNIKTLMSLKVDGIIADISQDTYSYEIYQEVRSKNIPIVFFDRVIENENFPCVTTNDRAAVKEAVLYALRNGYKTPAHLAGFTHINVGRERRDGFIDALTELGMPIDDNYILESDFSREAGYQNTLKLLQRDNPPDFILAFNDDMAQGVYDAAKKMKIKIPEQLGVCGHGNLKIGQLFQPPLSTIEIPIEQVAKNAVKMLIKLIEGQPLTQSHVSVEAKLLLKGSVL